MQRLEAKSINGRTYYYLSLWGWRNGKCRRLSQKYLGKPEDIARAVEGAGPAPQYAVVLDWGLPQALWQEAERAQVVQQVDQLCPKRAQGLSTGDYIRLAAINRACEPVSKQAMWEWVSHTSLPRLWPEASAPQLTSQHFWDHMDRIPPETAQAIWQQLIAAVLQREQIELSQVCYDGTNFYTFIDTFNVRCQVAKRGKNKQGRAKGGTAPTLESVRRKCEQILHRQHLRQLVQTTVSLNSAAVPQLSYQTSAQAQQKLKDTYLGKTLLITGHQQWTDAQVIRAYRSQFVIEEIFHEMKDRHIGAWWPLYHWTDSKIQVHGLYCTMAVLLRALLWRRAHQAGLHLSMSALLQALSQMRQVVNVFPSKRAGQPKPEQTVLTQRDDTQEKLIEILGLRTVTSAI